MEAGNDAINHYAPTMDDAICLDAVRRAHVGLSVRREWTFLALGTLTAHDPHLTSFWPVRRATAWFWGWGGASTSVPLPLTCKFSQHAAPTLIDHP
jgi:hypothetical protein